MKIIETANNSLFNFLLVMVLSRGLSPSQFSDWSLNQSFMFLIIGLAFSSLFFRANRPEEYEKAHNPGSVGALGLNVVAVILLYVIFTTNEHNISHLIAISTFAIYEYFRRYIMSYSSDKIWMYGLIGTLLLICLVWLKVEVDMSLALLGIFWSIGAIMYIKSVNIKTLNFKLYFELLQISGRYLLTAVLLAISARSFFIIADIKNINLQGFLVVLSLVGVLNPLYIYFDTVVFPNLVRIGSDLTNISLKLVFGVFTLNGCWSVLLTTSQAYIARWYKIIDQNDFALIVLLLSAASCFGFLSRILYWNMVSTKNDRRYDLVTFPLSLSALILNVPLVFFAATQFIFSACFLTYNILQTLFLVVLYTQKEK